MRIISKREILRRFALWRARRILDHAEVALIRAIQEIDRHAIVSLQASSLYRAHEARLLRLGRLW